VEAEKTILQAKLKLLLAAAEYPENVDKVSEEI
jgi:hypothetical protein